MKPSSTSTAPLALTTTEAHRSTKVDQRLQASHGLRPVVNSDYHPGEEGIHARLPSMSVDDIVTIDLDPPDPCGYCRRCAIHDDPGGCLEVYDWELRTMGIREEQS